MNKKKIIYRVICVIVTFCVVLIAYFLIKSNNEENQSTENIEINKQQNEVVSDLHTENSETEEMISVEEAWQHLRDNFFTTSELNEISYDDNNKLNVVTYRGKAEFSNGEEPRPCESVVLYDHQEDDEYVFGNYMVFYDGNDVYGTKTRGWYSVNVYTGEVSTK